MVYTRYEGSWEKVEKMIKSISGSWKFLNFESAVYNIMKGFCFCWKQFFKGQLWMYTLIWYVILCKIVQFNDRR